MQLLDQITLLAQISPTLPDLPNHWELSGRIVLAAVLGSVIGLERELTDHPSGLRTHIAVAVGAALFGICSAYAFTEFVALRNDNNYQIDVTRIASQVVVGVGFLGGGAIIKQGNTVRGLTSAAGLWVSAAVGLGVALGMYVEATVATVTLVSALILLRGPRRHLRLRMTTGQENVVVKVPIESDPSAVISYLQNLEGCTIHSIVVKPRPDDGINVIEAQVESKGGMISSKVQPIEDMNDVLSVEVS